ncbi:unnamed protein product [Diplocarpon coronariae]|uniref:Uncharacterized protein n=1 Tax=Diplocarpon coronariae TaxID=2795749 RepID=A0A218YYA9_9HELO|nr:hypothetical protein JHW43_004562 [Diplocarpon mali]OWP00323.1 hypothetical protein B2J93_3734 [Marssonina coronariae]
MSALARAKAKRDRALAANDFNNKPAIDPQGTENHGDGSIVDPFAVFSSSRTGISARSQSSKNITSSFSPYQPEFEEEDDRYLDPGAFEFHDVPLQSESFGGMEAGGEQEEEIDYVKQSEAAFLGKSRGHSSYDDEDDYDDQPSFYTGRCEIENDSNYKMSDGVTFSRFDSKKQAGQSASTFFPSKNTAAPKSSLRVESFSSSKTVAAHGATDVTAPDYGDRAPAPQMGSKSQLQPSHSPKATVLTTAVTPRSYIPIESTHRTSSKRSADDNTTSTNKFESEAHGAPLYRLNRANKRRKPTERRGPAFPSPKPVNNDEGEDLETSVDLASKAD